MATMVFLLLLLLVRECQGGTGTKRTTTQISKGADYHIEFNESKLTCKVSRQFVSVAFGVGQLNKTETGLNPGSLKLRNILKGLSPCYFRVGGSKANFLFFEPRASDDEKKESDAEKKESDGSSTDESTETSADDQSNDDQNKGPTTDSNTDEPKTTPVVLPTQIRLESRAVVPIPSVEDLHRPEAHKYKRFTLELPKLKKTKQRKKKAGKKKEGNEKTPKAPKKPKESVDESDDEEEDGEDETLEEMTKKERKEAKKKKKEDKTAGMTRKEQKKARKAEKQKKIDGYKDFTMTADQFDMVYNLVHSTGNRLLFDVNVFPRSEDSRSWNSSNAEKLLDYAEGMGYKIDWQLGNEPNHYHKFGEKRVQPGELVGNDYIVFKNLVKAKTPNAQIIGPDITQPKKGQVYNDWLSGFLKTAGDTVTALGWHHYYVDGKDTTEEEFVNADILDNFVKQNELMKDILKENDFTKPTWLTESGSAWGGGAEDLSDRYAGMFPYVDKLGVAGNNCIQVVARQSLLSGKYALINKTDYEPHPEYYAAALFKRLAAKGVLNVQLDKHDKNFRVYARCARKSEHTLPGSVFFFILNLSKGSKTFALPVYELFALKQYLFTADSLRSDVVKLNGKPLRMVGDKLPKMRAVLVDQPVKVPGLSIGFYVLDSVSLDIC